MEITLVIFMLLSRYFNSLGVGSLYFFVNTFSLDIFICFSFLQVREDPVFRREGSDIHVDAVLSITQVMIFDEETFSNV